MVRRTLMFLDGENLVARYQALKKTGEIPREDVLHDENCYIWSPAFTTWSCLNVIRVTYYATSVGDDPKTANVRETLGKQNYSCTDHVLTGQATVIPHIFKKKSNGIRSRHVDIQMTLDILHAAYNNPVDSILIGSGDGDFLPVIKEVGRTGKQVYIAAFSSGLNPELIPAADVFIDLDKLVFHPDT